MADEKENVTDEVTPTEDPKEDDSQEGWEIEDAEGGESKLTLPITSDVPPEDASLEEASEPAPDTADEAAGTNDEQVADEDVTDETSAEATDEASAESPSEGAEVTEEKPAEVTSGDERPAEKLYEPSPEPEGPTEAETVEAPVPSLAVTAPVVGTRPVKGPSFRHCLALVLAPETDPENAGSFLLGPAMTALIWGFAILAVLVACIGTMSTATADGRAAVTALNTVITAANAAALALFVVRGFALIARDPEDTGSMVRLWGAWFVVFAAYLVCLNGIPNVLASC